MKINIAGVNIDNFDTAMAVAKLHELISSGGAHYIVTPYSEQIVFALQDKNYLQALNNASMALPDGVGILWAAKFLSLPRRGKLLTLLQWLASLLAIVFSPAYIRSVLPARVTGSGFIWDVAELAYRKNYSLCLVGGVDNVAQKAASVLQKKFPDLKINLAVSDEPFDDSLMARISASNSDILLIAYSPPKQELWLAQNIQKLNVKAALGLGGTFDYLAQKRLLAPKIWQNLGLEWLWRLITQPWRVKRMWNAVGVFSISMLRHKISKF